MTRHRRPDMAARSTPCAGATAAGTGPTPTSKPSSRGEAARALADAVAAPAQVTAGPWPVPRGSWDLLVNTTPVGTYPDIDRSPVDADALRGLDGALVYDLVYNPRPTRLLRDAAAAGCRTLDGL